MRISLSLLVVSIIVTFLLAVFFTVFHYQSQYQWLRRVEPVDIIRYEVIEDYCKKLEDSKQGKCTQREVKLLFDHLQIQQEMKAPAYIKVAPVKK